MTPARTPAPLTPDDAADALKAILRRHLPANAPQLGIASHRMSVAVAWGTVERLRQVRAIALELGLMEGATPLLRKELERLREDITRRLAELGS